jgi:hypothetical protein
MKENNRSKKITDNRVELGRFMVAAGFSLHSIPIDKIGK